MKKGSATGMLSKSSNVSIQLKQSLFQLVSKGFYKRLVLLFFTVPFFTTAFSTNYYIDNLTGNNANNGTSSGTAWADFTNVNSRTFVAGDQVLLKSGCVWNSELHLQGSGNSSSFIILDAYGSGAKPKIQRNSQASDRTVYLDNTSYWKVRNIEICNAGDGIRLAYTGKGYSSVYFEGLYIHDINLIVNGSPSTPDGQYYSTGIFIYCSASKPTSVNDYVATDIRVTNCEIGYTTAPITFLHIFTNSSGANTESPWSFKNAIIDNNYLHDFKGPISSRDLNNSVITNNICKNGGTSALPQGTTGFFNFNLENVTFEGNVMDNIPNTNSPDQTWVDNEAYCNNVKLFGNLIKNTPGAGIEFLALGSGAQPPRGSDDYNTNNLVDGNTFSNNSNGALHQNGNTPALPSGTASNNVYLSGNTFFTGNSSGFTLSNNTASSLTSSNLALYKSYIASSNYDDTQRASKAFDGSSSTNWQSAAGSGFNGQWLRVNFGSSTTFNRVVLSEYGNRTSGFRIEYSSDGITWQTAYTGTSIGASNTITFSAVSASMARIYFTSGSSTPIIYEFEISNTNSGGSSNLALNKTYISSSNWDASQTADKACDGNLSTNWQSANGGGFANQWVGVNFGAATAFDSIRISEYGDRTSGYRIEYSTDGNTWQTAFTGTSIGASKILTFPVVTGNYGRIYFTSGTSTPIIYEFEIYKKPVNGSTNLALNRTYNSSSNWDASQTADKACDGSQSTNWQSANGSEFANQWLRVNFGASTTFNKVVLSEYGNRTSGYRIEYSNDGTSWQTAYTGTTIGASASLTFTAVTANYARIYFTGGANTPIIYEFEIYNTGTGNRIALGDRVSPAFENGEIVVYPNPTSDRINVKTPNGKWTYQLFNSRGILLLSGSANSNTTPIDVRKYSSGIYLLQLESSNGDEIVKTVVKM